MKKSSISLKNLCSMENPPHPWVTNLVTNYREEVNYGNYPANVQPPPAAAAAAPAPCSIFRVPTAMRGADQDAYDPKVVTIGPFHYHQQVLNMVTQQHKIQLLFRSPYMPNQTNAQKEVRFRRLAEEMTMLEQRTRSCYSEFFAIDSEDFVRMMVLDGCFILHLLRCCYYRQLSQEFVSGSILTERWIVPAIGMDLVRLENHLPFFVLQKLYHLTSTVDYEVAK
ncbi:hypothetical protein O6P43_018163 [Quillaja saponaria]|uniref:Uncharacterized protein n=1 Tax=Quillaja saponaria TaxID=32244 RepID=A0AAD7PQD6_QUISA|nr:hypothetical protein O6P43_018163 [Quillaja saponaria]